MTDEGPDMDRVEELVKDHSVKGMWCVPKYSNPEGITYSDKTVRRIANLKGAPDLRVFWDNAYALHMLKEPCDTLLNFYDECKKAGNPNLPIIFASTSKITFPGAGIAAMAASPQNVADIKHRMGFQTIGPDKLNQLRHARMFKSIDDIRKHMRLHASILRPKFDAVLDTMEAELRGKDIAFWKKPSGGYFISLNVLPGCAKRTVELCGELGLKLTPAGSTYPLGLDPEDSNIRLAPSYPSVEELNDASKILCCAVKFAALEKLIG